MSWTVVSCAVSGVQRGGEVDRRASSQRQTCGIQCLETASGLFHSWGLLGHTGTMTCCRSSTNVTLSSNDNVESSFRIMISVAC